MNPLFNMLFLLRLIKEYLFTTNRLNRLNFEQIQKYRNKAFRKTIKYSYNLPLYHDKYKTAGINPDKIHGTQDISKLPFLTKKDLKNYYPDGLLPAGANKKNFLLVNTSGTTKEPISIYTEYYEIFKTMIGFLRIFKEYDISWNKSKITIVADLSEGRAESTYLTQTTMPYLKPFFSLKNIQVLNQHDPPKEIIKKINAFKPDFLGASPYILTELTILKKVGYSGKKINPKCIASSGGILDIYTKKHIKEIFPSSHILDSYGATECGTISFQCKKGNQHIFSDFVYVEVIDKKGNPVPNGQKGEIVVTRLYGKGTPIIRYKDLHDIITLSDKKCNCGINTPIIQEIQGRKAPFIRLNNGKIFSRFDLTNLISKIEYQLRNEKIIKIQIVQNTTRDIDILVKFYEYDIFPKVTSQELLPTIKNHFVKTFGSDININIKEIEKLSPKTPLIISKVTENESLF